MVSSQPQVKPVFLKISDKLVTDEEKDRESDRGVPQRRVLGHDGKHGSLDHVVDDVRGQWVLAKRSEDADLDAGDITEWYEQSIERQRKSRWKRVRTAGSRSSCSSSSNHEDESWLEGVA